jgi:hypothetical protein
MPQSLGSWSGSGRSPPYCSGISLAIPYPREREQLAFIDFKTVRLLHFFPSSSTRRAFAGIGHLRSLSASRNAGLAAAVSALALIICAATDEFFAHEGISPQRTSDTSRMGSLGFWRMIGTGWVGAML